MTNIVVLGRIRKKFPIREFNRQDGTPGIVGSFIADDGTGECKVVLWGEENIRIMQNDFFKQNEVIRVIADRSQTSTYKGVSKIELHVGAKGKIFLAPSDVNDSKIPRLEISNDEYLQKSILLSVKDINLNYKKISIRGVISQIYKKKEYNKNDGTKDNVQNIIVKDKTDSVRITFWNESTEILVDVSEDDLIFLTNLKPKEYDNHINLTFTKYSSFEIIESSKNKNKNYTIAEVQNQDGYLKGSVIGNILEIEPIKPITKRTGEIVFLLRFILSDDTSAILVNVWGDFCLEVAKIISIDLRVVISKGLVKFDENSQNKILNISDKSKLEVLT